MGKLSLTILIVIVVVLAIIAVFYIPKGAPKATPTLRKVGKLLVDSKAFKNYTRIPAKYTCDGLDASPPLSWKGAPPETKAFIVIVEDPDAPKGIFTHWVLYGIPANVTSLPEGVPKEPTTPYGMQGFNDFGRIGYNGPCPPPGKPHRYVFKVYAVDAVPPMGPGARKTEVEEFALEHAVAVGILVGLYGR